MKKRRKKRVDLFRKQERQKVREVISRVKKHTASDRDYSDANHDFSKINRCFWW